MPLIIRRQSPAPSTPESLIGWALDKADQLLAYLRALVTLDAATRATRSQQAERATLFVSAVVTNAAVTRLTDLVVGLLSETYTTALVSFDGGSGPGRWRIDGSDPTPATATAAAGMPIPAGGVVLTIAGRLNIQDFRVTAEAANLNMSVTLFK
jgi:hypothetical protein